MRQHLPTGAITETEETEKYRLIDRIRRYGGAVYPLKGDELFIKVKLTDSELTESPWDNIESAIIDLPGVDSVRPYCYNDANYDRYESQCVFEDDEGNRFLRETYSGWRADRSSQPPPVRRRWRDRLLAT